MYKRLVLAIADGEEVDDAGALFHAYHSFVSDLMDDYNGGFYYDSPAAIYDAYATGKLQ